jgi:hypothetical protein
VGVCDVVWVSSKREMFIWEDLMGNGKGLLGGVAGG